LPAIDRFLQDVRFSCVWDDVISADHPATPNSASYEHFFYILGRDFWEAGRIEEALYCFKWVGNYIDGWDDGTNSYPCDADLFHSHLLRLKGRYIEAASLIAGCLGGSLDLTDEVLAECAVLVVTAPEVYALFGLGGCYCGVRFAPRLVSILGESKPWV
jgi:hypothetical protein